MKLRHTYPRPRVADLIGEAAASLRGNAARSLLTGVGVVLASTAFVVVSGLTTTLSRQVSAEFDTLRATEVGVRVAPANRPYEWGEEADLARLRALPGVVDAGTLAPAMTKRVRRPPDRVVRELEVRPVDAATLRVVRPKIYEGRAFDGFHVDHGVPVVLLSRTAALRLQVPGAGGVVDIDGREFTVIGIFDSVERRSEMLLQGLVPLGTVGPPDPASAEVLIETAPGAAGAVARNAALALHPEEPRALIAGTPIDPTQFRKSIESNVQRLAFGAVAVALLMGVASLANSTTATVYARTAEIGLRGVVGAQPRHVFAQLLVETSFLGLLGGILGSLAGVVTVVFAATWNGWRAVLDPGPVLLAVVLATAAGLVAGLGPAWRATRIQAVDALRR